MVYCFGVKFPNLVRRLAPVYGPHYGMAAQGILRGLGLIYLLSFWSLASQIQGLSGPTGLQPAGALFSFLHEQYGAWAPVFFPGLGWISQSVGWMLILCALGALAGIGLLYGCVPWGSGFLAWVCWVSLIQLGQPWVATPSDLLLAEAGLFALCLVPVRTLRYPRMEDMSSQLMGIVLINLLLLKLTFMSGWSRIYSGSGAWGAVQSLGIYLETQPFPTTGAWWLRLAPEVVLKYILWGLAFIELMLPWFTFLPRTYRNIFAGAVSLKALVLLSTGHHGTLPWITLILALSLVDDVSWRRVLPSWLGPPASRSLFDITWERGAVLGVLGSMLLLQTVFAGRTIPIPWRWVEGNLVQVVSSNRYLASPEIPKGRIEIELLGSLDGRQWVAYPFWMKPGNPERILPSGQMHTPRLDLAFSSYADSSAFQSGEPPLWLLRLIRGLLAGDPTVTALFPTNPFPEAPPRFLRLMIMEYEFASPDLREGEGVWWRSRPRGTLGPVYSMETVGTVPSSP